jgi:hypothetical protein
MRPTHDRWPGEDGQGVGGGASGGGPAVALRREGRGLEGVRGSSLRTTGPTGEAGRAWGRREGVGVTRHKLHSTSEHPVSGRIRTRSVQPSAIRSAQGRVCVHRWALSPEHSR